MSRFIFFSKKNLIFFCHDRIRKHRKNAENGNGPPVLFLNAGDTYTGTPWFSLSKENITTQFLNALAPEAMVSCNNKFFFTGLAKMC